MIRVRFSNVGKGQHCWESTFPAFDPHTIAEEAHRRLMSSEVIVAVNREDRFRGAFIVGECVGAPRIVGYWQILDSSD